MIEWISLEKERPKNKSRVLVYTTGNIELISLYYNNTHFFDNYGAYYPESLITHWSYYNKPQKEPK